MKVRNWLNQNRILVIVCIEMLIIAALVGIALLFWGGMCSDTWSSCVGQKPSVLLFFFFCLVRPFVFTPSFIIAIIAGAAFGGMWGTILTCLGNVIASVAVYAPGKILGKSFVYPWVGRNLPETGRLVRRQGFKIALIARLIPIIPFDLTTLFFGIANIRIKHTIFATLLGSLPMAFLFSNIGTHSNTHIIIESFKNLTLIGASLIFVGIIYSFFTRNRGGSLWRNIKKVLDEVVYEIKINNDIFRTDKFSSDSPPVILLYGFFSSRRTVVKIERRLRRKGINVMSFNLGGLLGVFFTTGLIETANFVKSKIDTQVERHEFKKLKIIGYSKGGLVALWYVLKLGGHRYVNRVVTMATPFSGTYFTYLALITPLGLFWKDMWQMRPGSQFLSDLNEATIPEDLTIFCFYGSNDTVSRGRHGVFRHSENIDQIRAVPFEGYRHYDFLHFGEVIETLILYLNKGDSSDGEILNEVIQQHPAEGD